MVILILIPIIFIVFLGLYVFRLRSDIRKKQESAQSIFYNLNRFLKGVLEQQEAILNIIPDLVWVKDCDGKFIVTNTPFQKFFGLISSDLLGKTDYDILSKEMADKYKKDDQLVIDTRKTQVFEEHISGVNNKRIIAETKKTPVFDDHGEIVGTLGIAHDITKRKENALVLASYRQKLEQLVDKQTKDFEEVRHSLDENVKEHGFTKKTLQETEKKFEVLLEKMAEGFIAIDSSQRFLFANDKFCEMLECEKSDIIGHYASEFMLSDSVEINEEQTAKRKKGDNTPYEISFKTKKGKKIDVLVSPMGIFEDGKFMGAISVILDLTQVRKNERELKRSNEALEQFAFVASHDLQEPLRMITTYLTLLSKHIKGELDEKGEEFLSYAIESASDMHVLVKDLLEYSRIKEGGLKEEPVALNGVLKKVLHNLSNSIKTADAQIIVEDLPVVIGDDMRYVQLFQNLISNGIKFRSDQKPIIKVMVEDSGFFWKFTIQDNGIGIEPKNFEKVFRVFSRLHSKDKYYGTGIGLAICKNVIESHGGNIWIEPVKGDGSKFCFTLPKKN